MGPKRYLGPRDPVIEVWANEGGGGSEVKVQDMDKYPVNKCIYTYIHTYAICIDYIMYNMHN